MAFCFLLSGAFIYAWLSFYGWYGVSMSGWELVIVKLVLLPFLIVIVILLTQKHWDTITKKR